MIWTPKQIGDLKNARAAGASRKAIAQMLGMTEGAVVAKLHMLRVVRFEKLRWTKDQTESLIEMRARGMSASEMATALGFSVSRVNMKLHYENLTKDSQRSELYKRSREVSGRIRAANTKKAMPHEGYEIGYIVGVLLGDGSIWKKGNGGTIRLRVRSKEFALKFMNTLVSICPPETRITFKDRYFTTRESTFTVSDGTRTIKGGTVYFAEVTCCNRGVREHLTGIKSNFPWTNSTEETRRGIIDGLFDSEGYFVQTRSYAGIKMKNHTLIQWLSDELKARGVENKTYKSKMGYVSRISIHKKKAVQRFCGLVKFSVPKREGIRVRILGEVA